MGNASSYGGNEEILNLEIAFLRREEARTGQAMRLLESRLAASESSRRSTEERLDALEATVDAMVVNLVSCQEAMQQAKDYTITLDSSLKKSLNTMFPRVDSLLSKLERRESRNDDNAKLVKSHRDKKTPSAISCSSAASVLPSDQLDGLNNSNIPPGCTNSIMEIDLSSTDCHSVGSSVKPSSPTPKKPFSIHRPVILNYKPDSHGTKSTSSVGKPVSCAKTSQTNSKIVSGRSNALNSQSTTSVSAKCKFIPIKSQSSSKINLKQRMASSSPDSQLRGTKNIISNSECSSPCTSRMGDGVSYETISTKNETYTSSSISTNISTVSNGSIETIMKGSLNASATPCVAVSTTLPTSSTLSFPSLDVTSSLTPISPTTLIPSSTIPSSSKTTTSISDISQSSPGSISLASNSTGPAYIDSSSSSTSFTTLSVLSSPSSTALSYTTCNSSVIPTSCITPSLIKSVSVSNGCPMVTTTISSNSESTSKPAVLSLRMKSSKPKSSTSSPIVMPSVLTTTSTCATRSLTSLPLNAVASPHTFSGNTPKRISTSSKPKAISTVPSQLSTKRLTTLSWKPPILTSFNPTISNSNTSTINTSKNSTITSTPNSYILNMSTPNFTSPKSTTPNLTSHKPTTPNSTTPKPTTPNSTTPNSATPTPTTPNSTTLDSTTRESTLPNCNTPYSSSTTSNSSISSTTRPYSNIPNTITFYPFTRKSATPDSTTPIMTSHSSIASNSSTPDSSTSSSINSSTPPNLSTPTYSILNSTTHTPTTAGHVPPELNSMASLNQTSESALLQAARDGDEQRVAAMLDAGWAVNAPCGSSRTTMVHWAASGGRSRMLELLLSRGGDPHCRDGARRTPLHAAAFGGSARCVIQLVAAGADVESADGDGWTPLHLAAIRGKTAALQELLAAGACSSACDRDGKTPSYLATTDAVRRLLSAADSTQLPSCD